MKAPARIGVLGGTFDPVHRGHLSMARAAERACRLQQILFVPAAHPWHRTDPQAGYADRYAMVALALRRAPNWLPLDLADHEATYSVDQLRRIQKLYPASRLFFIVGADAFATLPSWKQPSRLLSLCDVIILARAGLTLEAMIATLPPRLRPPQPPMRQRGAVEVLTLTNGSRLHWLSRFRDPGSSTQARQWLSTASRNGTAPVAPAVAGYARRAHLYTHG